MSGNRTRKGNDFSRLPGTGTTAPASGEHVSDQQGRRSLFSAGGDQPAPPPVPATGAIVITCGECGEATICSPLSAVHHAIPSLHLPYLKRGHGSWMRCPACGRRTWVSVRVQL